VALTSLNLTSTIVLPTACALTNPLASTEATEGFVLAQIGAGPDGGIPESKTTSTDKDSLWPTRNVAAFGTISIAVTRAISAAER
jgi:hypothetical protein